MANVKVSYNLDLVIDAEDEDAAQNKVERLLEKLNLNLRVEKGGDLFTREEEVAFDSMEHTLDEEEREVQDVEEVED